MRLDLSQVRRLDFLRPALDTITAHVWWRLHRYGPAKDWRALALAEYDALALPHLDIIDSDGAERGNAIRGLYDEYRTAAPHKLCRDAGYVDWLVALDQGRVQELLGVLIDLDAEKGRFHAETSDLERLNLKPILGFGTPQLQLTVRRRSARVLLKFVQVAVPKGKGVTRTDLPGLDSEAEASTPPKAVL